MVTRCRPAARPDPTDVGDRAKKPEPPRYDSGAAPVSVKDLRVVLDRDLVEALKSAELAPATGGGLVIGVIQHGVRRVFAYGTAKEDSIFEIGSITKIFTGLILAQMVEQRKVNLDEPVRELLPDGIVSKPAEPEITLLDLATQRSGLPRMPDNFHPANPEDPYADYGSANLYEYLGGAVWPNRQRLASCTAIWASDCLGKR
jgi:D-alanyl-D-alanine-carboxypeptidase/D-alanyl-D-alanine-endopeptidase